jgi:hypothetical protein
MSLYHLKPCMSRSRIAWFRWVNLAERSRSSFALFVSVLCAGFSLSLLAKPLAAVSGKSRLWLLDSMLEPITGVECQRRFSPLGQGEYSYDVELYAFAKMLCFRKNVHFRLNSEISFEVSFGASSLLTIIHETNM